MINEEFELIQKAALIVYQKLFPKKLFFSPTMFVQLNKYVKV